MASPGRALSLLLLLLAVLCCAALAASPPPGAPVRVTHAHASLQHLILTASALGDLPFLPPPAPAAAAASDPAGPADAAESAPAAVRLTLAMIEVALTEPVHVTRVDADLFPADSFAAADAADADGAALSGLGLVSLTCDPAFAPSNSNLNNNNNNSSSSGGVKRKVVVFEPFTLSSLPPSRDYINNYNNKDSNNNNNSSSVGSSSVYSSSHRDARAQALARAAQWLMPLSAPAPWLSTYATSNNNNNNKGTRDGTHEGTRDNAAAAAAVLPAMYSLLSELLGSDLVTSRLVFALPLSATAVGGGHSTEAGRGGGDELLPVFQGAVSAERVAAAFNARACRLTFLTENQQTQALTTSTSRSSSSSDSSSGSKTESESETMTDVNVAPGRYVTVPHRLSESTSEDSSRSHSDSHSISDRNGYDSNGNEGSGYDAKRLTAAVSQSTSLAGLTVTVRPEPHQRSNNNAKNAQKNSDNNAKTTTKKNNNPVVSLRHTGALGARDESEAASGPYFGRLTCPRARAAAAPARALLMHTRGAHGPFAAAPGHKARSHGHSRRRRHSRNRESENESESESDIGAVFLEEAATVSHSRRSAAYAAAAAAARAALSSDRNYSYNGSYYAAGLRAAADADAAGDREQFAPLDVRTDRSWIGRDDEVAFLSVGAMAGGINYGQLAAPLVKGAAKGLQEPVSGAMLAHDAYQINSQVAPALDSGMEDLIVRELVAASVQPINVVFPYSIAAVMQARLPQLIADATAEAVKMKIVDPITREATRRIQRTLARTLPETAEAAAAAAIIAGAGSDLLHTLVLSIPTAIVPALANMLVHDPRVDYYCYYCYTKSVYCTLCNDHREKTGRQVYYAQYYTDFYARHYGLYYKDFFVREETERLTGSNSRHRRLQGLADNRWNKRDIMVIEDVPGPYEPPPLRLRGEKELEPMPVPKYLKTPPKVVEGEQGVFKSGAEGAAGERVDKPSTGSTSASGSGSGGAAGKAAAAPKGK